MKIGSWIGRQIEEWRARWKRPGARRRLSGIALAGLLVGLGVTMAAGLGGCQPGNGVLNSVPGVADGEAIRICTFNIQVFGTSKIRKKPVTDVLVKVIRKFDVIAIQEIRATDDTMLDQFLAMINEDGSQYRYVIGPRLGRTTSKEQYAFVYNSAKIEVIPNSTYTVEDPGDLLHREPLVTRFRVRGPEPEKAFTFSLVNIHTDPDETKTELDALADVFERVQNDGSGEDDVILLGDLNVDDRKLGRLGRLPEIRWVVSGVPTNTRGTKQYDNILFNGRTTHEFTNNWGVLNLLSEFGLTMNEAIAVSDHLPVWAEFRGQEAR